MSLTKRALFRAGDATVHIALQVGEVKQKERWLHGVLLGYLQAKVGKMRSEWRVSPGRINLRHGGTNPSVIELVVRFHGVEEAPAANRTELAKLCRVKRGQARTRFLLILDVSGGRPVRKEMLQRSYGKYNGGPGKFERKPVRVLYVHPDARHNFDFAWSPFAG